MTEGRGGGALAESQELAWRLGLKPGAPPEPARGSGAPHAGCAGGGRGRPAPEAPLRVSLSGVRSPKRK